MRTLRTTLQVPETAMLLLTHQPLPIFPFAWNILLPNFLGDTYVDLGLSLDALVSSRQVLCSPGWDYVHKITQVLLEFLLLQ